mgnify:CR=1 FL=1
MGAHYPSCMRYKFFRHTADAMYQAYGKTIEEAFSNAASAMFSVMVDVDKVQPKVKRTVAAEGSDYGALLYNFLEELIFLIDTEGFLLSDIEDIKIKDNRLEATAIGDTDIDSYEHSGDVKAVTYNNMFVKEDKGRWVVQVVLDL